MNPTAILWPVGALAILTFSVLMAVPYRRFRAGFAHQVRVEDFRYGESANVPGEVCIRHRPRTEVRRQWLYCPVPLFCSGALAVQRDAVAERCVTGQ